MNSSTNSLLLYWCWLQELLCSCADVVPEHDDDTDRHPPNPMALYCTIDALLQHQKWLNDGDNDGNGMLECNATNTNSTYELPKPNRNAPNSLDLSKYARKRKYGSVKFQLPGSCDGGLNEIVERDEEDCEYDSDIGKFRCKEEIDEVDHVDSDTSSTASMVDYLATERMNDLNSPLESITKADLTEKNIIEDVEDEKVDDKQETRYKIVLQRIEYFEANNFDVKITKVEQKVITNGSGPTTTLIKNDDEIAKERLLANILFSIFVLTVALLIIFPLPN